MGKSSVFSRTTTNKVTPNQRCSLNDLPAKGLAAGRAHPQTREHTRERGHGAGTRRRGDGSRNCVTAARKHTRGRGDDATHRT